MRVSGFSPLGTANKHVVRADLVADGNGSSDEAHAHRQRRSNRAL